LAMAMVTCLSKADDIATRVWEEFQCTCARGQRPAYFEHLTFLLPGSSWKIPPNFP